MVAPAFDRKHRERRERRERRELVSQAAEALAKFGLVVPADVPNVREFLRHIITAAATHGALRERAAAPRQRQEQQRQRGGDVDNTVLMSTSLFDPEDWLPAETE